ncbi:hypothetical protein BDV97DRAFT_373124 [Delphinella strobiligena]|nr:hypothetical protein BDV97DRAFT_373124 [Delphinella strobiligena]
MWWLSPFVIGRYIVMDMRIIWAPNLDPDLIPSTIPTYPEPEDQHMMTLLSSGMKITPMCAVKNAYHIDQTDLQHDEILAIARWIIGKISIYDYLRSNCQHFVMSLNKYSLTPSHAGRTPALRRRDKPSPHHRIVYWQALYIEEFWPELSVTIAMS